MEIDKTTVDMNAHATDDVTKCSADDGDKCLTVVEDSCRDDDGDRTDELADVDVYSTCSESINDCLADRSCSMTTLSSLGDDDDQTFPVDYDKKVCVCNVILFRPTHHL